MASDEEMEDQHRLREAAARWHILRSSPTVDQDVNDQFHSWLATDEQHRLAFAHTTEVMEDFNRHAESPEIKALLQETLNRTSLPGISARKSYWIAAAAAIVLCLTGLFQWIGRDPVLSRAVLQTASGEIRSFRLRDDSVLILDAQTRLVVTLTRKSRTIMLENGQARFQVAHGDSRPFQVLLGHYKVVATGTDFNVERFPSRSIITLLEGGVSVAQTRPSTLMEKIWDDRSESELARLTPGNRLDIIDDKDAKLDRIDVRDVVAWQRGQILFDNDPLALAVSRFNRYTRHQVILDNPDIGSHRISGMFMHSDPKAFARATAEFLHLEMHNDSNGNIHLAERQ